jgi:5-hydroxyisourate hydrolase-like protein (transthyretin family)
MPPRRYQLAILLLGLLLCLSTSAASAQSTYSATAGGFRIAGTVVNALGGNPLPRARVTIEDTRDSQKVQYTITSEDGRFEFTQLDAGKYALSGAKRGFITASYEQHEQFSTAIVTGAGVDTEHLVLRLPPFAILSGKVLDEAGDPVRQATVSLYAEDRRSGVGRIRKVRQEMSDDQGTYEFAALQTGTYFIAATATPWYAIHPSSVQQGDGQPTSISVDQSLDVAYPLTYYKDATEPDDASPIPVRAGDHLEADIQLSPVPALHLRFHVPENENGFNMPVLQRPSFDGMEHVPVQGSQIVSPGLLEITGVPAGRYTVRMPVSVAPGEPVRFSESEMDLTTDGQELDSAKGQPTSSLKASVKLLGEANLPRQISILLRNSKSRVVAAEQVNEKGEVDFPEVTPGRYQVLAQGAGQAYSVLRISTQGHETAGHSLDVAPGSSLDVSLTLVGSATKVEGFAKRNGHAAPGAMVVLVPHNPKANHELFRRDQSDLDGSFTLPGVIPGPYTVCAIEDGWDLDWAKPAVIAHYCEHGLSIVVADHREGTTKLRDAIEVQPK